MFPDDLLIEAEALLAAMRKAGLMIATAESCTGGLIAACLTEIAGSSDIVDRGFVTYSNEAKHQMLGVPIDMIATNGAVSETVARAMALGALEYSRAGISIAVTGIAGPGGGTPDKPVGLVHIVAARKDGKVIHEKCLLGDIGRTQVRLATVKVAFELVRRVMRPSTSRGRTA